MKKKLLLLINVFLVVMIVTSCNNSPINQTVQTQANTKLTIPEATMGTPPEATMGTTPGATMGTAPEASKQTVPETPKLTAPEATKQPVPEATKQTPTEPIGEILSPSEAQDVLNNWGEWNKVYYLPDLDKQEDRVPLYGFLVDYSNQEVEESGETYCYAWVNSSTEIISFEEAGYSEAAGRNLYANIPDQMFPIPSLKGVVIPYDQFSPPDHMWGVAYYYKDKSVMKSYQAQLKKAGFVDLGTVQSVESLWQYKRANDGAVFTVEMYGEDELFSMNLYITY